LAERGTENTRRYPRLRARCRVLVRDRYGTWEAETEDLGPRGCRIVTPRPQTVGTLVGLTVASDALPEKLEVTGQVVWTTGRDRPARAGISFAGSASVAGAPGPAAWFAALAAAESAVETVGTTDAVVPPPPDGFDVPIDENPPEGEPAELARRLVERARELIGSGDAARAELLLRRALALSPGDAAAEALLKDATDPAAAG
jgi:hypothetical protein